ncbi:U3 small nucleolar ribonucleoprotein complex, subunit Mpp10 [Fusarium flagelliforme]|nr:U3 small nucleolar ribonucleoprotein complex, subunit Mpp10 [Fusarium flagelliforme]KAH7193037.1 U3 small nucleolar ribonucleoprotein complex, subunit Mpp10 [Fusarium flagelliforme]
MAAQTSPSLTSTSHTLTAAPPAMAAHDSLTNSHVLALLETLADGKRHNFLQPTASIPTDSLNLVKHTLEGFASQVGDEQQERLKENRKRKRGAASSEDVLKMRKVYIDGFETGQVWQQAKRIIGGVLKYSEEALADLEERKEVSVNGADAPDSKTLEFGEDGFEVGSDDEDEDESDQDLSGEEDEEQISGDEALEDGQENDGEDDEEEAFEEGRDDYQEDDEEEDQEDGPVEEYEEDPDGLNDGFFSLDDFNRQSQYFEEQDAKGDPYTDQASDDEEINWDADPLAPPSKAGSKSKKAKPVEDDEDSDNEGGPTFGDMDLYAPEGASDDEGMDMDDVDDEENDLNANEVYYKDFFAPPAKKFKGGKPRKSVKFQAEKPDDADVERAMADVRRDLFDDDSEEEDSEDALSDASAGDPKSRKSAHERRQAKLAEEIRKLEAASVAKREWALSGEAAAVDRPMNSLLEEDLDFEHVGKPVPVITPEVSESIEDLIKRRILAQEFDEVIKRRPDTEGAASGTRRGLIELDDSKATKGLAEIYEEEHVKNNNPDSYVSQSDEKLQKEEKEVEAMWKDVCARLDALSSWHYKPKPAAPSLSVVADVATIAMEDAQPTTAQGVTGESSRMAPQEVYKAGSTDNAANGEVVTKAGLPVARQEMSREDKARRRRREKERVRKAGGVDGDKVVSKRAKMQRDAVADLKKGGVKVINRKGEITDVDGKKAKNAKVVSSGNYKL